MQPKFIHLPEKKVVGLGTKFISILSPAKNNAQVIPALWHQFIQLLPQIPHRLGNVTLGLVECLPRNSAKSHADELFYIACAEVSEVTAAPPGMLHRIIPAGQYASFTHKGKLDRLQHTMNDIYRGWLPKSGLQLRDTPHLELYDDRFNPASDQSEFDVLLPVL